MSQEINKNRNSLPKDEIDLRKIFFQHGWSLEIVFNILFIDVLCSLFVPKVQNAGIPDHCYTVD